LPARPIPPVPALLLLIVLKLTTSAPVLAMPPPLPPRPPGSVEPKPPDPAVLSVTVLLVRVSVPALRMPAPAPPGRLLPPLRVELDEAVELTRCMVAPLALVSPPPVADLVAVTSTEVRVVEPELVRAPPDVLVARPPVNSNPASVRFTPVVTFVS
jgi:hypothetical protein